MGLQTSREPFSVHRARRNNTRAREPMSLDPGSRAPPGVHGWISANRSLCIGPVRLVSSIRMSDGRQRGSHLPPLGWIPTI